MRNRRFRALSLAFAFFLSIVFPVRQSQAVVPLVGLAVAAIAPSGAVLTADLLTAGVTALIGGTIAALAITPNNADAPMRVPLVSDKPTIDAAMPPPAAPTTAAAIQQTNAAACAAKLAQLTTSSTPNGCSVTTSYSSNGESWYSGGYYSCGYNRIVMTSTPGCESYNRTYNNDGTYQWYQPTPNTSCPSGYTQSGSNCTLVDARAAASDGKADISRSASGYSANTAEKDPLPSYANVSNNKVYASGKDSSGRPVMIEYSVSADGSKTYITHYTQSESATQTTVKTQSITVDSATGTVTGASVSNATGSISPATSAGVVPTVQTGTAVTTGSDSGSIVFPTDYARAGEAAAAAGAINAHVDQLKNAVESLKDAPATENPEVLTPGLADVKDSFLGANNPVTGLLGWHVPGFTGICPTADINFDWKDFSYHGRFESHCAYADQFRATAATIFDALWVIVAFFIVLGA